MAFFKNYFSNRNQKNRKFIWVEINGITWQLWGDYRNVLISAVFEAMRIAKNNWEQAVVLLEKMGYDPVDLEERQNTYDLKAIDFYGCTIWEQR